MEEFEKLHNASDFIKIGIDYKTAYENILIANKMLDQERKELNKQIKILLENINWWNKQFENKEKIIFQIREIILNSDENGFKESDAYNELLELIEM